MTDLEAIEDAEKALRDHIDDATVTHNMGLMDLIEVVTDRHTKAASELRRLKKAVIAAGLEIGYLVDGQITLMPKGGLL